MLTLEKNSARVWVTVLVVLESLTGWKINIQVWMCIWGQSWWGNWGRGGGHHKRLVDVNLRRVGNADWPWYWMLGFITVMGKPAGSESWCLQVGVWYLIWQTCTYPGTHGTVSQVHHRLSTIHMDCNRWLPFSSCLHSYSTNYLPGTLIYVDNCIFMGKIFYSSDCLPCFTMLIPLFFRI